MGGSVTEHLLRTPYSVRRNDGLLCNVFNRDFSGKHLVLIMTIDDRTTGDWPETSHLHSSNKRLLIVEITWKRKMEILKAITVLITNICLYTFYHC